MLEFTAFLRLRYTAPRAPRPFMVSGGMITAWVLTIVKMVVVLAVLFLAGAQWTVLSVASAFNAAVILLYLRSGRATGHRYAPHTQGPGLVLAMQRRGKKGFQRLQGDVHNTDPHEIEVESEVGAVEGPVGAAGAIGQEEKVHTI